MSKFLSRLLCGIGPLVVLAQPATGWAQTADTQAASETASPGDIVVTARRSSESLLKVPVAVTAVSADTVVRANVANLTAVSSIVPFVQISKASAGTGALVQIRGIGSPLGDSGVQQTVLTNIDNVLINRGRAVTTSLFDIAQVEVLKGPQALFFGRNSTAGVVSVSTATPGHELAGYVRGGYEFNARERYIDAAVDLPVTPTLAVRLAGHLQGMRGFIKNNAVPELFLTDPTGLYPSKLTGAQRPTRDYGSDTAGRITVKWTPVDQFSAIVKYTRSHNADGGDTNNVVTHCLAANGHPSDFGVPDLQSSCQVQAVHNVNKFPAGLTAGMYAANDGNEVGALDVDLLSAALHYDAGKFDIDSVSGYFVLRDLYTASFDGTSFAQNFGSAVEHAKSFSEELRLTTKFDGPLNFVVGGYYGHDKLTVDDSDLFLLVGPSAPGAGDRTGSNQSTYYTFNWVQDAKTTAVSGFAQARYNPTENIEISAGGRYTREHKTGVYSVPYARAGLGLLPSGSAINHDVVFTNFSPEAGITWHPSADQTVYATYHTGYKSGGFSSPGLPVVTLTAANTVFSPEKAKGFEIGYKAALLDRRVTFELVAYRYEYTNLQVSAFDSQNFTFVAGNAGKARTTGVEAQVNARVMPGLQLGAAVGYNEAKFVSFPNGACYAGQTYMPVGSPAVVGQCVLQASGPARQNLSGLTLPRAPRWQGMVNADYDVSLSDKATLHLNGRVKFSSGYNPSDQLIPGVRQPTYALLDLGAEITVGAVSFGIQGQNLTNKLLLLYTQDKAYGNPGDFVSQIGRNRQIRLTAGYKF